MEKVGKNAVGIAKVSTFITAVRLLCLIETSHIKFLKIFCNIMMRAKMQIYLPGHKGQVFRAQFCQKFETFPQSGEAALLIR